jgi:hypothetical protein
LRERVPGLKLPEQKGELKKGERMAHTDTILTLIEIFIPMNYFRTRFTYANARSFQSCQKVCYKDC